MAVWFCMALGVPAKVRRDKDNLQIYFQQTWNQCFRHHGEEPETEQPGWQAYASINIINHARERLVSRFYGLCREKKE